MSIYLQMERIIPDCKPLSTENHVIYVVSTPGYER